MQDSWQEYYEAFVKHASKNPQEDPPPSPLALWVKIQRTVEQLNEERRKLLSDAGFMWDGQAINGIGDEEDAVRWEHQFSNLVSFKHLYGDCEVPFFPEGFDGLGEWVCLQRFFKEEGLDAALGQHRVHRLDGLNFSWGSRQDGKAWGGWEERYKQLEQFVKEKGHCIVSSDKVSCACRMRHEYTRFFGFRDVLKRTGNALLTVAL